MARFRDDWDKLIELFAEIAIPRKLDNDFSLISDPWILRTYPPDYSNKEVLSMVPNFAHPCSFKCDVITHFSFVLTNIKSKWTFGYCRHTPDNDTSLVILSDLPWHSTFFKILDHCAELSTRKSSIPLERFLEALYTSEIPQPGLQLIVTYTVEDIKLKEFIAQCPDNQKLPRIPEDRNITEYYNAISSANMIAIFASMLNERRIVMVSEKLNRLSACVQAANTLIYPMHWQHIFIPLLPNTLIDYLTAPMPFLIGVPQCTFDEQVKLSELGEIVLLNVDTNQLTTPFDDVSTIPSDVLYHLRKLLKNIPGLVGDGLCRAFLRSLVMLIGGYREALCFLPGEKISFDRDAFVSNVRGTSRQLFLENMLQLQIFQQFIESRLDILNRGERFVDQFEIELNHNEQTSNSRFLNQYREWAATMRKEGGAFLRAVNPKVKSAFSMGRQAFRQVRQKITAPNHNNMNRPNSEPSSPKLPPTIKKSISGNFIPTPTSRTVTYVRNPQFINSTNVSSTNTTITGKTYSKTNGYHSEPVSSTLNVNSNNVAPSASSESSDIDDNEFQFSTKNRQVNFSDELESIFNQQATVNNIPLTNQRNTNKFNVRLPIPPPRTININRQTRPITVIASTDNSGYNNNNNNNSNCSSTSAKSQCLIEFDSPPKEIQSDYQHYSINNVLMFDPLLDPKHNSDIKNNPIDILTAPEKAANQNTFQVSNSNFYLPSTSGNNLFSINQPSPVPSSLPTASIFFTSKANDQSSSISTLNESKQPPNSITPAKNSNSNTNSTTPNNYPIDWLVFD